MGIYEYLVLTDNEQWQLIWDKSNFITNYKSIDRKFQLRTLDKLFIELELDVYTDTIIAKKVFVVYQITCKIHLVEKIPFISIG